MKKEEAIEISTPGGIIKATLDHEPSYPAIKIEINGEYAAVVEYDTSSESFRIRTYQGDEDEPYSNVNYLPPTESAGHFVAFTRVRDWENYKWTDYFISESDNPEQSMRNAVLEFLQTGEGKQAAKDSSYDFNWGDAIMYVPSAIWKKHGIEKVSGSQPVTLKNPVEIIVNQDEVLIPEDYNQED